MLKPLTIKAPFANYHRAKLERLVRDHFLYIERNAAIVQDNPYWEQEGREAFTLQEFQVLMAADAFLRATKEAADADAR